MLASLMIPMLSIDFYPIYIQMVAESPQVVISTISQESIAQATGYNFMETAFLIYAFISLIFIAKLLLNVISILRLIIKSSKRQKENIKIVVNNNIEGVFSFYKYIFCNSEVDLNKEIFTHEKIHVQQGHTFDIILSEFVKSILWFNPVIYFVQSSIKLNHEFICDSYASKISGVDSYSRMMIYESKNSSRFDLKNNFSMYIKKRLMMLFNNNESRRLWTYLLIVPMVTVLTSLYSFEEYYVPVNDKRDITSDTLPDLKIIKKSIIDTVAVYDNETKKERLVIVKNEAEYVEVIDTLIIFDSSTYEETVKINKFEIPLEEYYKNRGANRLNYLNDLILDDVKKKDYRIDTISLLDYDSGVFVRSVIHKINKCYTFFWGDYAFSDSHLLSHEEFKEFIFSPLKMDKTYHKECMDVETFSFRIILIPKGKDPRVITVSNSRNSIPSDFIPNDYIIDTTKVFIEDIKVNGEKVLNGIVLTLY